MGQTLENGVYLPSEGERNCYAGLKTNWEILDQKVADVTALQQAVAGALHREIVESLPTTDIDPNTIYMILSGTSATENVYNEYMYVNNAWELIGTSATDLTNYYTKAEVDGKLLLKANASDLTSHTGDTTIHVTTADKTKWNNGVSQSYVFRYSSTALVASSTNSNTLLDNTDNLKVGDKVIDSSGVLFSITAIDTANSTFTIGTALIDLAKDSDVVHTSGDETVGGVKTFSDMSSFQGSYLGNEASANARSDLILESNRDTHGQSGIFLTKFRQNKAQGSMSGNDVAYLSYDCLENSVRTNNGFRINFLNFVDDIPQRFILWSGITERLLGVASAPWSGVYATNYYYGNDNVEFSTKFVTTDTNQDISANKNFKGLITTTPDSPLWSVTNNTTADITSLASNCIHIEGRAAGSLTDLSGGAWYVAQIGTGCFFFRHNAGTDVRYKHFPTNVVSKLCLMSNDNKFISDLCPNTTNSYNLGDSTNKWKTINGVEPSSLSLPDLNNGIDISSYLTVGNSNNTYTPSVNGWISISTGASSGGLAIFLEQGDMKTSSYSVTGKYQDTGISCFACLPVVAGVEVNIELKGSGNYISSAKFFPCQGNV